MTTAADQTEPPLTGAKTRETAGPSVSDWGGDLFLQVAECLHRASSLAYDPISSRLDGTMRVSGTEFALLRRIRRLGGSPTVAALRREMQELSDYSFDFALDYLLENGSVRRSRHGELGRLTLTPSGEELLVRGQTLLDPIVTDAAAGLDARELVLLGRLCERLAVALRTREGGAQ